MTELNGCMNSLDWTTGLDYWTTGLDYWTGLLNWTTGLDYWTGLLDWTTGLIKKCDFTPFLDNLGLRDPLYTFNRPFTHTLVPTCMRMLTSN